MTNEKYIMHQAHNSTNQKKITDLFTYPGLMNSVKRTLAMLSARMTLSKFLVLLLCFFTRFVWMSNSIIFFKVEIDVDACIKASTCIKIKSQLIEGKF
jgi:hypothetical protein